MKTLNQLRDEIHEIAKSKGFHDSGKINISGCLMLIVSELSEALEADRRNKKADLIAYDYCTKATDIIDEDMSAYIISSFEKLIKDSFEDELADAIIRILDLCGALNIDIEKHVELKMEYNKSRERMHGKKY